MKKILLSAASAVVLLAATPAWADCTADLQDFNKELSAGDDYRATVTPRLRADVRQLRNSAYLLEQAGQTEACDEVVAAIKDMVNNPKETTEKASDQENWNKTEIERLKSAQSLDQLAGRMRAEEIIGSDIRNLENKDLGEIDDILMATSKEDSSYAIISHGGFLGLGAKQVAVPIRELKVTTDKDIFVLNISEEQIESAPSFERGKFDAIADDAWRKENDTYFQSLK